MSLWSRKSFRVVVLLCAAVLVFMAGRLSHRLDRYLPPYRYGTEPFQRDFVRVAKAYHDYLIEHDGFIPADPYRALVESGKVASFSDFLFDGHHHVDMMSSPMPVRVNPHLEENAKIPLLRCVTYTSDGTFTDRHVWVAWADGTVTYEPITKGSRYYQAWEHWSQLWDEAGYPYRFYHYWPVTERAKWMAEHRDQFVWDSARRIYVLPPAATTTAP